MCGEKQKIIQKRVQRRERYARMARIRYRKQRNVMLAKPEVLADHAKCSDDYTLVHQYSPGIFFGERNGRIDVEASMLNKDYITNNITVVKEGEVKLLRLKLGKGNQESTTPKPQELEKWKKREQPGWKEWAERFEKFTVTYKNFLAKHQDKFGTANLDEEEIQKYNSFNEKRNELFRTRNLLEFKTRFNQTEDYVSEIVYNSHYIGNLGYEFDEFVNKILREGIPRIKLHETDNGFIMTKMMENFESIFEKPLETSVCFEPRFLGKDGQLYTGKLSFVIAGYFLKNKAEISYIVMYDDVKSVNDDIASIGSLHMPIVKKEVIENLEGKMFLEKYYKDQCPCLQSQTLFREPERASSVGTEPVSTKVESDDMGIKEELTEGNLNNQNLNNCCGFPSKNSLSESITMKDNIILAQPQDGWNNPVPGEMLLNLLNSQRQMQNYMFLCQNNLFNYMSN